MEKLLEIGNCDFCINPSKRGKNVIFEKIIFYAQFKVKVVSSVIFRLKMAFEHVFDHDFDEKCEI